MGPLLAAWALGTETPLPPPPRCQMWPWGRGERVQGPAGSGHSVVLSLPSQPVLCQLPGLLAQHFLQPTFQRQWLGLPFPIQHKSYPRPFLSHPPRCQGLGSALSDHGRQGDPALPSVGDRRQGCQSCLTPAPQPQKHSDPRWASWSLPLQSSEECHDSCPFSAPKPSAGQARGLLPQPQSLKSLEFHHKGHSMGVPARDQPNPEQSTQ